MGAEFYGAFILTFEIHQCFHVVFMNSKEKSNVEQSSVGKVPFFLLILSRCFLCFDFLQFECYSCLGNPIDRGAWWATVHRVSKSWT